jgi:autotransporter-associated beta strand protein
MKTPRYYLRFVTPGALVAAATLAVLATHSTQAQVTFSGTTGNWTNTATWTGGLIPGAGTNVVLAGSGQIGVSSAVSAQALIFSNASGNADLNISNGGSVAIAGAITDPGAGLGRIFLANTTEATATNRLTATSIAAENVTMRNAGSVTNYWGTDFSISTAVQFAVGETGSLGSALYSQNGGTNNFANTGYGLTVGASQSSTNASLTNAYNLNGGVLEALRIGAGNADGNGTVTQRYLTAGSYQLNFNAGTLQNRGSSTTLNLQNGFANNGTAANTMGLNTSAPMLLRLSASGSNIFNANGASSLIIVSPSVRVVDQTSGGTITKTGVGDLVFAGGNTANSNTWSGATTVSNGNVVVDYNRIAGQAATGGTDSLADAYSAASQLVLAGGGFTLTGRGSAAASDLTGLTLSTTSLTYTVGSTAGLVVGQAVTNANLPAGTYIRRIISGTQFELSNFATNAASSQTLNLGAASFANTQVINDVVLQASSSTITVNAGAGTSTTLLTFSNFSGTGSLNKAGAGTLALAPGAGVTNTLTGNLTGSAGTIAKNGAGRVILGTTNVAGNTFTGGIAVNEGTLQIGNSLTSNDQSQRLANALTGGVSVASGATLLFKNSAAVNTGTALTVSGLLTTDVAGVSGGGFFTALGALTLSNGGELRAAAGANTNNFQSYALNSTVTVAGTSASSITTAGGAGDGIHLANNTAANRTFNVADVTGNTNVDLSVSARLINAASGLQAAGVTKEGAGLMRLSGSNSFTGSTIVNAGTLELAATTGAAAGGTTSVTIGSTATLLISTSNQVNDSATVTLSGGTIQRAGGVSEAFSDLNVTSASTINFGGTAESRFLQFGSVTGGANLTIANFLLNNELRFAAANFAAGETIANSFTFLTSDARTYSFGSGTFTITAIPEPSAVLAALGLIGLGLWPVARKRLIGERESRKA